MRTAHQSAVGVPRREVDAVEPAAGGVDQPETALDRDAAGLGDQPHRPGRRALPDENGVQLVQADPATGAVRPEAQGLQGRAL